MLFTLKDRHSHFTSGVFLFVMTGVFLLEHTGVFLFGLAGGNQFIIYKSAITQCFVKAKHGC